MLGAGKILQPNLICVGELGKQAKKTACGATAFSIKTLNKTTLSIMKLSFMSLSIKGLFATLSKSDAQNNNTLYQVSLF